MVMAEIQSGLQQPQNQLLIHRGIQPSLVINHHVDMDNHQSGLDIHPENIKKQRLSHCVGCGGQIHDQYILRVAPDLEWHAACLKCQECRQFLDESCTCFVRDGKTYCKRDYVRLFGTKCDKCGNSFCKNDFVMRAKSKIYHIECFRCSACAKQLIPGDEFALRDGGVLYCKSDHNVLESSTQVISMEHNNNNSIMNNNINISSNNNKPTTMSSNSNSGNLSNNNHSSELGSLSESESESGSHKSIRKSSSISDGKPTRVRTVLNEKQLHTLRTCYGQNARPDALMKEQLVEMTGLSPRVIRVWFQNKRCKDKKKAIQMKMQMQQEKEGRKMNYGAMQGIPMVASSPIRHESPLNMHGHEVSAMSYQPPWKALSDFALHADLEGSNGPVSHSPAFQHLMNQMHGYDMPMNMSHHGPQPQPPLAQMTPIDPSSHHPDSTDSYVTYLESDESTQGSP